MKKVEGLWSCCLCYFLLVTGEEVGVCFVWPVTTVGKRSMKLNWILSLFFTLSHVRSGFALQFKSVLSLIPNYFVLGMLVTEDCHRSVLLTVRLFFWNYFFMTTTGKQLQTMANTGINHRHRWKRSSLLASHSSSKAGRQQAKHRCRYQARCSVEKQKQLFVTLCK